MLYTAQCNSPIGKITLASDGQCLIGLWIEGQKHFLSSISGEVQTNENLEIFIKTKTWLKAYFQGENPDTSDIALAPQGSDFRKTVWRKLIKIPYGKTISYGDIAKRISDSAGGKKTSARAVGGAVGRNPISIIIPCHRVIGADGGITGYAGGIDKKIYLLKLEGAVLPTLKSKI